jgi:carotenoid 1,2-hydratase
LSSTLGFDQPVPADGYRWWYVDALSDDGRHGLTIIAFIGSVFSPYYKWARRRGPADPLNYCAINVALYGQVGHRWAMTERGRTALSRDGGSIAIGPSHLTWDGATLQISLDEITVPLPRRITGRVRLDALSLNAESFALELGAADIPRHLWRPIAASARVEVALEQPAIRWRGHGYLDSNWGFLPLERSFVRWDWSRASAASGAVLLYDGRRRDGTQFNLALHVDKTGRARQIAPPPRLALPRTTIWRLPRATRATVLEGSGVTATLEDTPFYARSVLQTSLSGEPTTAIHERLELDRFNHPIVQAMLPFRMPRRSRWG